MKNRAYIDVFLLISLFLMPRLSFINAIFNLYDEVLFIFMVIAIISRVIGKKRNLLFPILLTVYILYSFFLIIYNSLPISHIMQIFITSKFLIIFLYFHTYSDTYKVLFFKKLMKMIVVIFIISLIISILQFTLPTYFYGYSPDGRGFLGINAGGIFFSRISYSSFLVMFIVLLMSVNKNYQGLFQNIVKYRYTLLLISLILLFLTFARKEMIIGFFLLIYLFKDKVKSNSKIIFYIILFFILGALSILFMLVFSDINNSTFTEKQIRFLMLFHSWDVFSYYFPFGSGPGTYGSIMSMDYTLIYEKFNVEKYIYLGHGNATRGPIFDLFLFGLLAEYGLGLLLILWFLKKMAFSHEPMYMNEFINTHKVKVSLVIHLFIVSMFVPIFLNWVGFLIFTILGVLSGKGNKNVSTK